MTRGGRNKNIFITQTSLINHFTNNVDLYSSTFYTYMGVFNMWFFYIFSFSAIYALLSYIYIYIYIYPFKWKSLDFIFGFWKPAKLSQFKTFRFAFKYLLTIYDSLRNTFTIHPNESVMLSSYDLMKSKYFLHFFKGISLIYFRILKFYSKNKFGSTLNPI